MRSVLPDDSFVADDGVLVVGGCRADDLAHEFGTPLIVFDRATFENRARSFAVAAGAANVFYAAKAFCCVAVAQLTQRLGLSMDVCSGGELTTALAGGMPAERLIFHGNNKSPGELEHARGAGVGRVVVDSFDEIDGIKTAGLRTKLLVRVTPGVEAHTHEFVQTGQEDSKFGFTLAADVAMVAIERTASVDECELIGIHAHIGSQIFETTPFELAIDRIGDFLVEAKRRHGFEAQELNLGGGFGIAHTRDEVTPDPEKSVRQVLDAVDSAFRERDLSRPRVCFEPGRAIAGPTSVTLYEVGTVKRIPGVRTYVSVDGGMSDNIRPPLYGARYEAFLANRAHAPDGPRVTIAGKHCESGDVLIKDVHLPDDVAPGDLLCIPATGAYTYSMANNYNRVARPAVVMVDRGRATEIIRRETYDDLLRADLPLNPSTLGPA